MVRKLIGVLVVLAIVAAGVGWFLTAPKTLAATDLPEHTPDVANGKYMFFAGGCESCHAAQDAKGDDIFKLGGGLALKTPFGTFHAPNISPDKQHGIGNWSLIQFVNAMKEGVRPDGAHLYPAFPYPSYQRMKIEDIIDLKAFLDTLPPVASDAPPHELSFPFNIRRGLGLWKLLYVNGKTFTPDPNASAEINRGAYLVTGPAHCGECHSPRNFMGGIVASRALSGGPAPEGEGYIPNITPDKDTGIGSWGQSDIEAALETGFKPNFDSLGSSMAPVQRNMAPSDERRPERDRRLSEIGQADQCAQAEAAEDGFHGLLTAAFRRCSAAKG